MKMIEQSYGPKVHAEVLGDAVSKAFSEAIDEHKLRVAGQPRIEAREGAAEHELGFTAIFEVYPDIVLGDPAALELERVSCEVGEGEVEKTIEILRKQRVTWAAADRAAQDADRVTIDFVGTVDGVAFNGGTASDFQFVLGEGRMLPDFEAGVRGAGAGESRTFPVAFPPEYGSVDLAGKTAQFEVTLKKVETPQLPRVDEAFARRPPGAPRCPRTRPGAPRHRLEWRVSRPWRNW